MEIFTDFYNYINNYLTNDIYTFFEFLVAHIMSKLTLLYIAMMDFIIPIAWFAAKDILNTLNISSQIESAWSQVPSTPAAVLTWCRFPEAVNNIVTALGARFALKVTGFV